MNVTSSVKMRGSPRRLGAWALQVVVAAAFFAAGAAKLADVPFMIQIFDQIGVGQWFRIVTGVVEIVGALALVYPGIAAIGGLWLGFTMVCAVAIHVFVLHSSPAPAAVLLALNALIVYLRRDELGTLAINALSASANTRSELPWPSVELSHLVQKGPQDE
jgi:putative oxidoreductase